MKMKDGQLGLYPLLVLSYIVHIVMFTQRNISSNLVITLQILDGKTITFYTKNQVNNLIKKVNKVDYYFTISNG